MKMRWAGLALLCSVGAGAESNPLTQAVTARYNSAKRNLIGTAEAMAASDYEFKLSPTQRPFSAWIEHTALGNYSFCSAIRGTAAPDVSRIHGLTQKAELQKALQESFDYCDESLKSTDDRKALEEKDGKYPVSAMVGLIASLNDHYGNLVGYLRSKGITPPSSAQKK